MIAGKRQTLPFEVPASGGDLRGEYPTIDVPTEAQRAAVQALEQGLTHYVPVQGVLPLREVVATFLESIGVHIHADQVIVTGGEQEARFLALQGVTPLDTVSTLAARGDRQARFLAVWDAVHDTVRLAVPEVADPGVRHALNVRRRRVASLPADETLGFLPAPQSIEKALAGGSNLVYLESPSRLTGFSYDEAQVHHIANLLEKYGAHCVWDQSTAPAVSGHYTSLYTAMPDRTLAIGVLWPGMGLTAWQIGYIAPPSDLAEAIVALKQVLSICTATPAQWAAVGAGQVFAERHAALLGDMKAAREAALTGLEDDPRVLVGHAVNVLALKLGQGATEAVRRLSGKEQIAGGAEFGAPSVVRVTVKRGADTRHVVHNLLGSVSL